MAAIAALLRGEKGLEGGFEEEVEPEVKGVGVARAEQTVTSDGVRAEAVGHLEQGGAAFTDVGAGVVIAVIDEPFTLLVVQLERSGATRGREWNCDMEMSPAVLPAVSYGDVRSW